MTPNLSSFSTRILCLLLGCFLPIITVAGQTTGPIAPLPSLPGIYPKGQKLYDRYPNSVMYYYAVTVDNPLLRVLTFYNLKRWPEHIQTLELAHTLNEGNFLRCWLSPIVGVVQIAANVTVREGKDEPTIYEFNPYLIFRWANLPWNDYVTTSFAIGEGVSYATSVPYIERKYSSSDNVKRLLNYLMLEATFAHPSYPRLQLLARIHHRSGAFGLYQADNAGSNDIGLGIRYLFD